MTPDSPTSRPDLSVFAEKVQQLRDHISQVIVGQENAVELILTAILADGHVLLEGVPGVAKTLLAKLIARLIDARFSRVQFTPDLMPSDVLGTTVFNMQSSTFSFHPGPIFADIVLVDEINRAPAKTQAALFEVMEERQATVDGECHPMGPLYTILATQNPVEQEGTYKLPEAQLDRFMMKITMGYPTVEQEVEILNRHLTGFSTFQSTSPSPQSTSPSSHSTSPSPHSTRSFPVGLDSVEAVLTQQELLDLRQTLRQVYVEPSLLRYIAEVIEQTRQSKTIFLGASPRASVATMQASRAYALLQGRDFVAPDDIKQVAPSVLAHRIILTAEAEMEELTPLRVVAQLLEKVEVPK